MANILIRNLFLPLLDSMDLLLFFLMELKNKTFGKHTKNVKINFATMSNCVISKLNLAIKKTKKSKYAMQELVISKIQK